MQWPPIEIPLLLDLLLGLIVLMFVPFGIRRGAAKEAIVTAAILWSTAIAATWTDRWAEMLVGQFGIDLQTAQFSVAVAIVFGSAFVLGYGGGAALGRLRQGVLAHLAGGLLAALNGGLLVAMLLTNAVRYLPRWEELNDGYIAWLLLNEYDRLFLAGGGVLLGWVVLGNIVTAIRHRRQPRELVGAGSMIGVPPRQRPVRMARDPDAGKYEPELEGGAERSRPATSLRETTPLPENGADAAGWRRPPDHGRTDRANGHGAAIADQESWIRRAAAMTHPTESERSRPAEPPTVVSPPGPEVSRRFGTSEAEHRPLERDRLTWGRVCSTCGASVTTRDSFCPECGRTL